MLGDYYWVYASGMNVDASYRGESGKLVNRRRQHGDMVLSRFPILSTRSWPLPTKGSITRHCMHTTLLEAVDRRPGRRRSRLQCPSILLVSGFRFGAGGIRAYARLSGTTRGRILERRSHPGWTIIGPMASRSRPCPMPPSFSAT